MKYTGIILTALLLSCATTERNNPFDAEGQNWNPPVVTAMADTSVNINDSITITATATDNGTVVKYVWATDGSTYADTTASGSLSVAYADSGTQLLRVVAIDDDGVVSGADSCVLAVTLDAPVVTAMADTSVNFSTTTSVTVAVTAVDTNTGGSIAKYYWDIGADGWDDSTDAGWCAVTTVSGGAVTVRWGARDDDGVFSLDTFTVLFNRSPSSADVTAPTANESWVSFDRPTGKGAFPVTLSASDPDGSADTLTYTLYTGASAGSLTLAYAGVTAVDTLANVDSSATVHYRLVAHDVFGDSAVATGTFIAPPPPPAPAGMKFIPGGTFNMGSTTGDSDEEPAHSVTVSSFWMDTTEVTQKQYSDVMASVYSGYSDPSWSGSYGVGDNNPAYYVNWYDAVLYCNARTKASGSTDTVYSYTSVSGTPGNDCVLDGFSIDLSKQGYRLPTEAEWEYACRGGTTTDYYWGSNSIAEYAWYNGNSGSSTHPVAQKLPNAYGLYDMSGNVWEWCNDWYGSYSSGSATNPTGPTSGSDRVLRGGSWYINASAQRSASRHDGRPDAGNYRSVGFRVVLPAQ